MNNYGANIQKTQKYLELDIQKKLKLDIYKKLKKKTYRL